MGGKIAVIGAGLTGLTAAYTLAKDGFDVTVLEAAPDAGGLALARPVGDTMLEVIYHHIFTSDTEVTALTDALGLTDAMVWVEPNDAFYIDDVLYPFTSPLDLLRFKPLAFPYRVSMGLLVLLSRFSRDYGALENMSAGTWIAKKAGKPVYDTVWKPLMHAKFDADADKVAAVWIWNKFKLRGSTRGKDIGKELLGYMRGSFGLLYQTMAEQIAAYGGTILTDAAVTRIARGKEGLTVACRDDAAVFDRVLFTGAPAQLAAVCPDAVGASAAAIRYKANLCATLQLKKPLSRFYWTTVADARLPFVAVIEQTNIMPPSIYGSHIAYLTRYLDAADPLFTASEDTVRATFIDGLQKMYPAFDPSDVLDFQLFRARYAQPVIVQRYSQIRPAYQTPVDGLFLASMAQIYPEDRGMNYAIREGLKVARLLR